MNKKNINESAHLLIERNEKQKWMDIYFIFLL